MVAICIWTHSLLQTSFVHSKHIWIWHWSTLGARTDTSKYSTFILERCILPSMVLGEEYLLWYLDLDLNPAFTYFLLICPKETKITHVGPKMPLPMLKKTLKLPLYCRIFPSLILNGWNYAVASYLGTKTQPLSICLSHSSHGTSNYTYGAPVPPGPSKDTDKCKK